MKKGKKEKKMTNLPIFTIPDFPFPDINLEGYREITNRNIADFEVIHITWGSLLGRNNDELIELTLHSNPKFISHILRTKEDFKVNYSNFRKYPKMNESDWE